MTWPVRSARFGQYHGTPAANTPVNLGTVPTGKKWLVKEWSCYNGGATTRAVYLLMVVGGTTYVVDKQGGLVSATVGGNNNRHLVLNAGESIQFQTDTAQAIDVTCSGAQLG